MKFSEKLKPKFMINGSKRKGEKITGSVPSYDSNGNLCFKKKSFRKHKALPKGCKVAKRICIVCLTNVIRKNDNNYESKICKDCAKN